MKRLIITLITAILLFTAPLHAVQSFNYPRFSAFDSNGDPLTGAKLFFYENGTTTLKDTYSDYALTTGNTNPVVLDSDGVADVDIYLDGIYTVAFAASGESHPPSTTYWTINNVEGYGRGFKLARTAITNTDSPYTMLATDDLIEVDTSGGDVEIDLLSAVTMGEGKSIVIVLEDASDQLTLDPSGAQTISGASTLILASSGESVTLYSDGTNLQISSSHKSVLANDTWRQGINAAGTAAVNMIKVNASDQSEVETVLADAAVLAEQASAPTTAANQMGVFVQVKDGATELFAVEESDGDEVQVTDQGRVALPRRYISGLVLSNDTDTAHDIAIAVGAARDSTDAVNLSLSSVLTKQIDATFAAGDDAGGMFTGSVANSTWYHVFLIRKDSDGTTDGGYDTSAVAANIPTGYTEYRWIGTAQTDGSANILQFYQYAERFYWDDPALDLNVSQGTTAVLRTLSGVPTDVEAMALLNIFVEAAAGTMVYISCPNVSDEAPAEAAAPLATVTHEYAGAANGKTSQVQVLTNTSAQIRTRSSAAATTLRISTLGYTVNRSEN